MFTAAAWRHVGCQHALVLNYALSAWVGGHTELGKSLNNPKKNRTAPFNLVVCFNVTHYPP